MDKDKKYEFKPMYSGSSSTEVIGLESKFVVFSNHCYPTDQEIWLDVKNESRRCESKTLNLYPQHSGIPSIRYCSKGRDGTVRELEIVSRYESLVTIRVDDLIFNILFGSTKNRPK